MPTNLQHLQVGCTLATELPAAFLFGHLVLVNVLNLTRRNRHGNHEVLMQLLAVLSLYHTVRVGSGKAICTCTVDGRDLA